MRADARRNRARIVATAIGLFTERGAGVGMDEIARASGLGVGTLYRHFPDKRALLVGIACDSLRELLACAQDAEARPIPAWAMLDLLVRRCVELPLALTKSLDGEHDPELEELQRRADEAIQQIVQRAQQEGSLRLDIPAREVVGLLNVAVCRPGARAEDHLVTVILDGLRAAPGQARGGSPVSAAVAPSEM
ncbi:AcrR family transcriptional regulator [Thermocatellispora tengchongensis]|uniref:AcrR family transcriptional regulator n=1 Tax=Thermocatellispora tengchongensis TaxID=1073253 RepID=A0A840NUD9_9ACTN|nr:TetR/AcrR family transcriptional regulator [Thermocatellispora tengchongensis]MBB5130419.1 AcrR family transcriptional regulator [Thermocatellispora tengchongensis]